MGNIDYNDAAKVLIAQVAIQVFPDMSDESYATLLADLTTRESEWNRLADMLTIWKNNQSGETDVATISPSDPHESAELRPGMYRKPGAATVFKVQESKAGRLYAKELVDGHFEYARGAIFEIKPDWRLTPDELKAYGLETGNCIVCQRELTVRESVERGIGPVCFAKYS